MDNKRVLALHEEWQRAVRKHTELLRDTRSRGLAAWQIQKVSKGALVEVDAAYARLKAAEAQPGLDAPHQMGAALQSINPTA
jgi:hypothetical protein